MSQQLDVGKARSEELVRLVLRIERLSYALERQLEFFKKGGESPQQRRRSRRGRKDIAKSAAGKQAYFGSPFPAGLFLNTSSVDKVFLALSRGSLRFVTGGMGRIKGGFDK